MKAEMRSTMQTAGKVLVFNRDHPVTDIGIAPVIGHFDERVARANALIGQQAENTVRSKAAHQARETVRRRLADGLLRLFAESFVLAGEELPALRGVKAPRLRAPDPEFILAGERLVEAARSNLEVLGRFGLTAALVDEASGLLEQFRELSAEAKQAYQTRIEASKALDEIRLEITAAISRMDRLNRHRFSEQPEVLARWDEARNVVIRRKSKLVVTEPTPTAPPGGPGGDVQAAA